jgi:hypothetical protein
MSIGQGWKKAQEENKAQMGGGGLFVRLKDGESITGAIDGEPLLRRIHWVDKTPRRCAGVDCLECQRGDRARRSWAFAFFDTEANAWRIVELSPTAFDEVAELSDDLETHAITIKRSGSGMQDTRYRARLAGRITADLRQRMDDEERPDLEVLLVDNVEECSTRKRNGETPTEVLGDDRLPF